LRLVDVFGEAFFMAAVSRYFCFVLDQLDYIQQACVNTSSIPTTIRETNSHMKKFSLSSQSIITILISTLFCTNAANAAEDENIDEGYFQEFPAVLTASRLSQPQSESPSSITVIDRDMIKASGFRNVPELMRLVPGMYVGFADANRPVISFHGSADEWARRMQILIDGRSIYLPPLGGVNWADLPIMVEDIERIEVVRGPSSASHGTNSFYGVINIITQDALAQNGTNLSVTRGVGTSDASARIGKVGDEYEYRLGVGYRSDQGLNNQILYDQNLTNVFNFRSNYHPLATDNLDVQIGSSNGVYGTGILDVPKQNELKYAGKSRPEDPFRDVKAQSDFARLSWQHLWEDHTESKLTYSHTNRASLDPNICINSQICQGHFKVVAVLEDGTPDNINDVVFQGFTKQEIKSERNELELQNTSQFGDSNRLVWGGGVRRDYAEYKLLLFVPRTINSWQLFAHDEWRATESVILNMGTMFESNGMGSRSNSPRAALNYHFTPQHTMRFGVSTATRSPVMAEAFIDANNSVLGGAYALPAVALKPERVLSKEVGYLGEFHSLGVTVDARAYIEQVSDLIWWDKFVKVTPDGGDYYDSWANIFAPEYKGVDTTVKYHWDEGHSFAVLSYAYQYATASLSSTPTAYNSTTPLIWEGDWGLFPTQGDLVKAFYKEEYLKYFYQTVPKHSASLLWSERLGDSWQFSAGYYYRTLVRVGDVSPDTYINNGVTPETTMRRVDLRLAKSFKYGNGQNAEVAVIVQNATQDNYTKYGTINPVAEATFGRRGWVTASFDF